MPAWLFGLAIALFTGTAATAYLWLIRRRDDETAAGLLTLAGMRWRDFSKLVLDAMEQRGLHKIATDKEDPQEQSDSFILGRDHERWLLACKHGSAYRIGSAAVDELGTEIRLLGAKGGILVTEGLLDKGGRDKADRHGIEVLDGSRLWPEVRPLIDPVLGKRLAAAASARAYRHIGIAWLGAITLGAASLAAMSSHHAEPASTQAATPVAHAPASAAPPAEATTAPTVTREPTEAELEQQRVAVARALGYAKGLSQGVWITRSTLSVDRSIPEAEAWPLICREVEIYPYLRTVRVQLNPPPGSQEQVRWRQCKTM